MSSQEAYDPSQSLPTVEDFQMNHTFRFGQSNPEIMTNPYWVYMARNQNIPAWKVPSMYTGHNLQFIQKPIYTHDRFGATDVSLPNGDIIRIAGEHEDFYDPDFCVYNDIVKFGHDGEITIYGYPEEVFQPTDNHSTTYLPSHNAIYIIGGYQKNREIGNTLVYKLDLDTFAIECVPTTGTKPGWISRHECELVEDESAVIISGGKVENVKEDGKHEWIDNKEGYKLNLDTFE